MAKNFTEEGWKQLIPKQLIKREEVKDFLKKNYPKAYSLSEIHKVVGGSRGSIQHHVSRLYLDGSIDRKSPYYRFKKISGTKKE